MTLQFRGRLELLLPHSRPPCRYDSTHRESVCTAVSRIRVEGADLSGSPVCAYSIYWLEWTGVREADTRQIMGGTLIDDVWVPPGTMERTSPPLTIHPCRNPLLPPGIYTNGTPSYIYPHPCATLCALRRHAEWNELSNQLGFKPIASRDGSYAVATHTRA